LFKSLAAFVDQTQENITGEVVLELYKGNTIVASRTSDYSLYNMELATYTSDDKFDHKASTGFMTIYGLPYKTMSIVKNEVLSKREVA
jgi:argininosuccinate synthase